MQAKNATIHKIIPASVLKNPSTINSQKPDPSRSELTQPQDNTMLLNLPTTIFSQMTSHADEHGLIVEQVVLSHVLEGIDVFDDLILSKSPRRLIASYDSVMGLYLKEETVQVRINTERHQKLSLRMTAKEFRTTADVLLPVFMLLGMTKKSPELFESILHKNMSTVSIQNVYTS